MSTIQQVLLAAAATLCGEQTATARFEQIVESHYADLYRFALNLTGNPAIAEDLTTEAFYLWAKNEHSLRDASKVGTRLFTTLYREFLRVQGRGARFSQSNLDNENIVEVVPDSPADVIDGAMAVATLQQLDEVYRAPLILFYLEQFSYQEIAAILGIAKDTVMSRLFRGKTKLRQILSAASHAR
jgi:RNA polymerase sigma factor (sigma-70 family)